MAVSMNEHVMMEPGLTQAVRIVLKYEIQSLLTRLADTGEEYIVLTASTDDQTCGHIGSVKGEGFVQSSCLENVKEEFLNFCTGDVLSSTKQEEVQNQVTVPPRQHRRKSTPKCKPQSLNIISNRLMNRLNDNQSIKSNTCSVNQSSDENFHTDESQSALDLSDRKNRSLFAYTLDYRNDSPKLIRSSITPEDSRMSHDDNVARENANQMESLPYSWKEEKIDLNGHSVATAQNEENSQLDEYSKLFANYIETDASSPKISLESERNIQSSTENETSQMSFSNFQLNQKKSRNKRKSKKGPARIKVEDQNLDYANIEQNLVVVKEEIDEADLGENDPVLKKNIGLNQEIRPEFTNMKSAFEEIGNMAKCLICNKILANKNNRTFHWRSHVGDKRYSCDICHKAFTHPSNMRSHRKIHTDEKPYPCNLCDRRFRRRDYLLQHLERFHYNPKTSESLLTDDSLLDNVGNIAEANVTL